jgi:hypothetical protein
MDLGLASRPALGIGGGCCAFPAGIANSTQLTRPAVLVRRPINCSASAKLVWLLPRVESVLSYCMDNSRNMEALFVRPTLRSKAPVKMGGLARFRKIPDAYAVWIARIVTRTCHVSQVENTSSARAYVRRVSEMSRRANRAAKLRLPRMVRNVLYSP